MALSKEEKRQLVAELKDMLVHSKAVVISDYRGLTASQMTELRNKLRPLNCRFMVAKNSMVLRALQELELPQPEHLLQGPTALAFCFGDFAPLRTITEFAKETEILSVKGGLLGNRIISAQDVQTLTELPALEIIRGQVLRGLQSPMGSFVSLLDSVLRDLLYLFNAHAEQLGEITAQ